MARLSIYLTPFSPDYSGVASVFFDLDALTVMHDASGCTGTYTGYDEPRWYGSHYGAYCSGLREIDAIMGNDDKLIERVIKAEEDIKAPMITIIGSPVPMVVGCDAKGIAKEIENITGIPSFGFDTTGTEYYDKGIVMAWRALIERFVSPKTTKKGTINILGLDAIDFPRPSQREEIIKVIRESGIEINASFPVGITMESLENLPSAALNVAVSASGLEIAREMERMYGIPYIAGLPYGRNGKERFIERIKAKLEKREYEENVEIKEEKRILIIGEAISSLALGEALKTEYGITGVAVASMFTPFDTGTINIKTEAEAKRLLGEGWDLIIADPEFRSLLPERTQPFMDNPTYSISSKVYFDRVFNFTGERFNRIFDDFLTGKQ